MGVRILHVEIHGFSCFLYHGLPFFTLLPRTH
jgi:hypothetical protein